MNRLHLTILVILIINVLFASGQIKSNYTPFEYSADTTKTICISEYQRDSLKYEILFYRDILEETKRTYLISQKTKFVDTVFSNTDSLVINYYTIGRDLLLRKVIEYNYSSKSQYFLNEFYFLDSGKLSYNSRSIIANSNRIEFNRTKNEEFALSELLQARSRYVYDRAGILDKVVVEIRIGGTGIRLSEYKNDKKMNQQDFRQFPRRKISIWQFWD